MSERCVHLRSADARRMPWKNGAGETSELAIWPPSARDSRDRLAAGDLAWRVSRAKLTRDGPFSRFPGFDRWLVVVEGSGFRLAHGDAAPEARLRPLEPYGFSGDWPTEATGVAEPSADFGVLVARGAARTQLEVLRLGSRRIRCDVACGDHGFLHVVRGSAQARVSDEERAFSLAGGESLWIRAPLRAAALEIAGESADSLAIWLELSMP